ncbi:MAG: hypothetical protein ABJN69_08465 [Hellea sp.]
MDKIRWTVPEMHPELLKKIFESSLTGRGARDLTSDGVEQLFKYTHDLPFRLQITEAHMIKPQSDQPMFEYSLSGPLPKTGKGLEADKLHAIEFFRKLNAKAQTEPYAMRYHVWFSGD